MPELTLKKRTQIFFVLSLLGTYLVRTPELMDEFRIGRFAFLTVLCLLALIFIFPKKEAPLKFHFLDFAFIGLYGLSAISLLWTNLPSAGYLTVQTTLLGLICYLCYRFFIHEVSNDFLAKVFLALTLFTIGITAWDFLTVTLESGIGAKHIYLVIGHSAHKNLLASFLFFLLAFHIIFSFKKKWTLWRYLLVLTLVIFIILLRCRAVYLAMGILGLALLFHHFKNTAVKKSALQIGLPILLTSVILSTGLFFIGGGSKQDISNLNPINYLSSGSGKERLFVWYKTSKLIEKDGLLGVGAGNWKIELPREGLAGSFRMQEHGVVFSRVHNDFLEVWAEQGILGLLFFLALFIIPLIALIATIRDKRKKSTIEHFILLGLLLGFALISFLDFPKERLEHQVLFAFTLAFIAHNCTSFFKQKNTYIQLSKKQWISFISILTIAIFFNIPISYYQIKGESNTLELMGHKLAGNLLDVVREADEAYSKWYQLDPTGIPIKWHKGLSLYRQQKFSEAATAFALAHEQHPYQFRVLNDYASCSVQLQDFEKAKELYKKALVINPLYDEAKFNLAYVLTQLNQFSEAENLVNQIKVPSQKKVDFLREINQARANYNNSRSALPLNIDNE